MTVVDKSALDLLSRAVADMSLDSVSAEQEYLKNPEIQKAEIDALIEWATTQKNLPTISEKQMILFYHSCLFNKKATCKCIENYYNLRLTTPEFFSDRDVTSQKLEESLNTLYFSALPVKDPDGNQIIFHSLQQYEPTKYVFKDGVKLLTMASDACLHVEGTVNGYIFLFDMQGVRLAHLTRLSLSLLRKFFNYIQEGMPVRLKAIHIVNTLPIIDKIMFMIKPFMKKELLNMIHFHSSNYEEVQEFLPKCCLPQDFDGDLPPVAELHENFRDWMKNLKPFFLEDEMWIDSIKRKDKCFLVESSNNSVEID